MKKYTTFFACALALFLAGFSAHAQQGGFVGPQQSAGITASVTQQAVLGESQISFERALEIATARAGGGTPKSIEWTYKDRRPVFELEIVHNRREYDIRIDAITGDVIRIKNESTRSVPSGLTQVTSARVLEFAQTAINRTGGGIVNDIEWKRDSRSGQEYIEFEIRNSGLRHDIRIDVATNAIIRERQKR